MARNPTTKSQVQAYQFVLRRMESALVRKDPVMLHEPMRTHLRAALVGLIIGALGVGAFFVVGLFSPDDRLTSADIVVGKQSGASYVVQKAQPVRLIPVLNLASARLLLASPGFAEGAATAGAAEVKIVEDSSLADAPRAPMTGIEGAPGYLPGPDRQVEPVWAVCDTADLDESLPDPEASPTVTTTAVAGVPQPGRTLGADQALLVESAAGQAYLVFDGGRNRVDLTDTAVRSAFRLGEVTPRPVSTGLLNAIPERDPIAPPDIEGAGTPVPFVGVPGQEIGDVVRVARSSGDEYFLLLEQGKQPVAPAVADLIRFDNSSGELPELVSPEDISNVPDVAVRDRIDFEDFPERTPAVVSTADSRVACLTWSAVGGGEPRTAITVSEGLDLGEGMRPVRVLPSDTGEEIADEVFVPPSKGALVRGVVPGQDPGSGTIFLVTDQGYRYGVPSLKVADAIGLGTTTRPAPEAILDLLPIGPPLDPAAAYELYDPDDAAAQQSEG